jgi:hypothetical protein
LKERLLAETEREIVDLDKSPEMTGLQTAMKARVLQVRAPAADNIKRPYDNVPVQPVPQIHTGSPGLTWSLFNGEWPQPKKRL